MITISAVKSPSGAVDYYTQDNYYTKQNQLGPSAWHGKGAAMLGLIKSDPSKTLGFSKDNIVKPEDFAELLNNEHIEQKGLRNKLAVKNGKQRAAHDLTFNAPKSVSIAALLTDDKSIEPLFQEAVKNTLDYAENELASVQINDKKGRFTYKTQNLLISVFNHNSSRKQQVHLHSHAVIHNSTFSTTKNAWRSHNNKAFFDNRYALTQFFYGELENLLNENGIKTRRTEHGSFEIEGISRETIEKFSDRTKEIKEQVGDKASWNKRNHAALDTREPKQDLPYDKLQEKWENDLEKMGTSKQEILESIVKYEIDRKANQLDTSKNIRTSIKALRSESNTFTFDQLLNRVKQNSRHNPSSTQIYEKFDRHIKLGTIVPYGKDKRNAPLYTTALNIHHEKEIIDNIKNEKIRKSQLNSKNLHIVGSHLSTLKEDQLTSAQNLLKSNTTSNVLIGRPGAGKSYTLAKVADSIRAIQPKLKQNKFEVTVIAPTHNAKNELADKLAETDHKVNKYTVAMFLLQNGQMDKTTLKSEMKANKNRIFYVDEASQLSNVDMLRLQNALKSQGAKFIVYAGDTKQNGALEAGSPLQASIDNGANTQMITYNARQKDLHDIYALDQFYQGNDKAAWIALDSKFVISPDPEDPEKASGQRPYIKAAVKEYIDKYETATSHKEKPYGISFDNLDVTIFANAIQEKLAERGHISNNNITLPSLSKVFTNDIEAHHSNQYHIGNVLIFNRDIQGKNNPPEKTYEKNTEYTITDINHEKKILHLKDNEGNLKQWQLKKFNGRIPFDQFSNTERTLHEGARIKFLKPNKDLDITTKQKGILSAIKDDHLVIKSGTQTFKVDRKDRNLTAHLSLDYVETSFVAQSKTKADAVVATDANSKAIGREATLVIMSRHKHGLSLHTNDKERFQQNAVISRNDMLATNAQKDRQASLKSRLENLAAKDNNQISPKIELPLAKEQTIEITK